MLFGAAALEVELDVVQRVANLLEGSFSSMQRLHIVSFLLWVVELY